MLSLIDSAVIAAIIAGCVSLLMSKSEAKLKHITEERKAWREKIREIAARLYESRKPENQIYGVNISLEELKVRINAYGINLTELPEHDDAEQIVKRYKNDGHIWRTIRDIEAGIELEKNYSRLVDYLSLLLKHDWERAKDEANGNPLFIKEYNDSLYIACLKEYDRTH